MQNIKKSIICFLFSILFFAVNAQKSNFTKGYYETNQQEKIEGFFDLDRVDLSEVRFGKSDLENEMFPLDLQKTSKIVCENGLNFIVIETINNSEKEFSILNKLLSGKVRLFRGFSKISKEDMFFIDSDETPGLKRINKSDPQSFLYIYFKKNIVPKHLRIKILYNRSSLIDAITRFDKLDTFEDVKRVKIVTDKYNTAKFSLVLSINPFTGNVTGTHVFDYKYILTPGICFGLYGRFNASRSLAVSLGFNYYKKKYAVLDSVTTTLKSPNHKTLIVTYKGLPSLKYDLLEIPLELIYRFYKTNRTWYPCVSIGSSILTTKNIDYQGEMTRSSYVYDPTIDFVDPDYTKFPSFPSDDPYQDQFKSFSYFISGFVNKTLNKHSSFDLGLKYTRDKEVMKFSTIEATTFRTNKISIFFNYLYSF